jgi:hypothetical protein
MRHIMGKKLDECHPRKLHFRFGGHPQGTWVELEWREPFLIYQRGSGHSGKTTSSRLQPSAAAWNQFWSSLSQIGVWSWDGDYTTADGVGGAAWSLEMSHLQRSVRCHGSNGYPGCQGLDFPLGSSFDLLLQSLQALTGERVQG